MIILTTETWEEGGSIFGKQKKSKSHVLTSDPKYIRSLFILKSTSDQLIQEAQGKVKL
jgi:hypothetical protein